MSHDDNSHPFIGLQIEAVVFQNREPEAVLDEILEHAPINRLMLFHQWDLRWSPHLGSADAHGHGTGDLLDRLQKPAKERGIGLIAHIGERKWVPTPQCPGKATIQMIDCFGRRLSESCLAHPGWIDFQLASVEDLFRQHPFLVGGMFMHERRGPISALLGGSGEARSRRPYCFSPAFRELAAQRGIRTDRAMEGFRHLYHLFEESDAGAARPDEGWFVTFWRLLTGYPEVLAWEQLFYDVLHDYRSGMVGAIKGVDLDYSVGYHVQNHTMLMDFAWRSGDEPERIQDYADWIKLSVYPAVSGTRGQGRLRKINRTLLSDLPETVGRDFMRGIMGRSEADEPDWFAGKPEGFAPSWIAKEIRRWKKSASRRPVYAGLGIGIPGGQHAETPEYITECLQSACDAGADGFLLSRDYNEMRPELVNVAGRLFREKF